MQSGRLRRARERRRRLLVSDRPLTVNDYLRLTDEDDLYELVDGVLVERSTAAMWQHEQLSAWLMSVLRPYVQAKQLGFVSGSRTAVQISPFRTRLPDMLFIRAERSHIITESLIVGAPDWVLEIRSRTNYPAEWHALELDYRTIGVAELWLVDPQAQVIRVARKADADYAVFDLREGRLESTAIEGFWVQASWLFFEAERLSPIDALRLLQVI